MGKIATKTIQYSIYDRTAGKAKFVDDALTYKRPSIEHLTDTFAGAGIMGEIDLPTLNAIAAMEGEITFNHANEGVIGLATPQVHTIEVRWVTNVLNSSTGNMEIKASKEIISYLPKNFELGEIENNETNESTLTYEILKYEYIMNGQSKIKTDKLNNVYMINGKDYSAQVRNAL